MKKYVSIIVIIGVLLGSILIYNTMRVDRKTTKKFDESGYILQSSESEQTTQNVERYYFAANSEYKNKYNEKVIFKDTDGENVKANLNNFIHYSNGAISSFLNGVLLNLNEIEENPIIYYNIKAGSILNKQGDNYTITNLDKELKFNSLLWKISPQKYIIIGKQINLVFDDGTNKMIDGYVEIEYLDNEIVKIYNQEATYQTISSKVYIELPEQIKLNLDKKIVSKNNENKMSLENMVIDSNDNVTIVDLEEENKENVEDEQNTEENQKGNTQNNPTTAGSGSSSTSSETNIQDTDTIINSGGVISSGSGTGDVEENQVEVVQSPTFRVEKFEINSIGMESGIVITDEQNLLADDTKIKIIKNSTGKTVYETVETLGNYNIDLSIATLEPDTEYTLVAESLYKVDDMTYTKDFLSKIFRTTPIGIGIEKDLFTDTSLQIAVNIDKSTEVKSFDVILQDLEGNKIQTQTVIHNPQSATTDERKIVEFLGLTSNTTYKVIIANVLYNTQVITNGFELTKDYTTLKERPTISGSEFEINKRDGNFKLRIKNIQDKDKLIQNYRFEVFDTRMAEIDEEGNIDFAKVEPIFTQTTENTEILLAVDDVKIFRNIGYTFRVVAIGNDNEKICEYESEYSNVFQMDGDEFPTVRFEASTVTYERIEGNIIVEDKGETIHLTDDTIFTVTYTDSIGTIRSFTSQGSYIIPVSINNLRANETYQFAVYTTVDLNDGNDPIEKCYIGGAIVKTDIPKNLVATYRNSGSDVTTAFKIDFRLQNENENQGTLEPETLTGMIFSIYAGQAVDGEIPTGEPIRTIKVVDTNTEPYESELKTQYYDKHIEITPEFFNAQNKDFRDTWYTITVTKAYDYTDYKNSLPILNNVYSIKTNGYMPDLPTDTENALTVTAIRNRNTENPREDLEAATIVGYDVKAIYDNTDLYARKIIYKAYNSKTNTLIQTIEQDIGTDGVIPTVTFNVQDGTSQQTIDNDALRRGNSYYFTYEIMLDLDRDGVPETKYPYEDGDKKVILKSSVQTPAKQEAIFIMYPSTSDSNSMTFKYKCTDIDNTIVNDKRLLAKIGNIVVDQKEVITTGTDEFETITFDGLTKGNLSINVLQNTVKSNLAEEKTLIQHKFEGINKIQEIRYTVSLDSNKVVIKIVDTSGQIDNIAAFKVKLSATDGSATVEKDLIKMPDNNIIGINYNDLGVLLKKEAKVEVFAYYNTGITGYDLEQDHYVTYKKAKLQSEAEEYYSINNSGKFVETTSIRENLYNSVRTENDLQIQNPINNKSVAINLASTENGFKYQGNVILQQRIDLEPVTCTGNDKIAFDLIIPGISLKDDNDEWTIQSELDNVNIKADLIVEPKILIEDQKIYIDIYETNENGTTSNLVKTETKTIEDFKNKITINDLTPKTYYYIKFRTNIILDNGDIVEKELYDIDYQVTGKIYYFSTLADVGINNIEINYEPVKYEEKYIDITYSLEKVTGYTRIEYKIYHYNPETAEYDLYSSVEPDEIFKTNMEKKIPINPGSEFKFRR